METRAWVLVRGRGRDKPVLEERSIQLPAMADDEVLCEPLYGCWEANMTHALLGDTVDLCRFRRESEIVLGNAAVVRILDRGDRVTTCDVGDVCGTVPVAESDRYGHTVTVLGYDARGSIGVLAKRVVLNQMNVARVPKNTRFSYQQWAGFPIRFATAWDNWHVTHRIWKAQFEFDPPAKAHVWAWGGGVAFAELQLAKLDGFQVAMTASTDQRLAMIEAHGITAIDRRKFPDLNFDPVRCDQDHVERTRYRESERNFLELVQQHTGGEGVAIFIDNIGTPVFRATLRSLGRLGVVTTSGWKRGKPLLYERPGPCVGRQIFVHTHGCRRTDGLAAGDFAEQHGWLPPAGAEEYGWDDIPKLAHDYAIGNVHSYFPIFRVNPV